MKNLTLLLFTTFFSFQLLAQEKTAIEIEDLYSGEFYARGVYGLRSMNDGEHYTTLDSDENGAFLHKYAYKNGEEVGTIRISDNKDLSVQEYSFSADESKVLLATDVENIYRHSTREYNYIYDFETKKTTPLYEKAKQRYATFSPVGNKVAFVSGNNLFVKNIASGELKQITKDGEFNKIINGATDWVYEEEFAFDKAFFWSPDGKQIAFYRFDESNVKEYSIEIYGDLYPKQYKYKYPKAGEENSKVTVHIYNLEENYLHTPNLGDYEYIPRIKWTKDASWLSIQIMNRHQNDLQVILANPYSKTTKRIIHEQNETYIDITDNLTFLDDNKHFIWTSEKSGYNHIYLYDMNGKQVRQITKGDWDVAQYLGYKESLKTIYYLSHESSPINKELYAISLNGKNKQKLSKRAGQNNVDFSKGFKYYINTHTDANTPKYVTLHNGKGELIRVLNENKNVLKALESHHINHLANFSAFKIIKTIDIKKEGILLKRFYINRLNPTFVPVW